MRPPATDMKSSTCAAQQGINSGKSHFAHYGYTLGGVLEHEYLDVRVMQNILLTEPIFNGDLHLFSGTPHDIDRSAYR